MTGFPPLFTLRESKPAKAFNFEQRAVTSTKETLSAQRAWQEQRDSKVLFAKK